MNLIYEFQEAKIARDRAVQALEAQRIVRDRTVHEAVIAQKGKLPVQAKARDEISMYKPGEILIFIDEDNLTSVSMPLDAARLHELPEAVVRATPAPKNQAFTTAR